MFERVWHGLVWLWGNTHTHTSKGWRGFLAQWRGGRGDVRTRMTAIDHLQVYVSSRESSYRLYAVINAVQPLPVKSRLHTGWNLITKRPLADIGGDNSCCPLCGEFGARVTFGDCQCASYAIIPQLHKSSIVNSVAALPLFGKVLTVLRMPQIFKICCK